jgi:hypothetical protein
MQTVKAARPTSQLPPFVEIRGRTYQVRVVPAPILVQQDGFWRERHYVADHDRRRFDMSDRIPVSDRRFVLARALVDLNSQS